MQITLLHKSKIIILYQWNEMGKYIVELVCIGTINTNMSHCLCHNMWRSPCVNINKKTPHTPNMYPTNEKAQIMGPKLSEQTTRSTNLYPHLKTENIYKSWQKHFSIMQEQLTSTYWQLQAHYWRHSKNEQNTPKKQWPI